MKQIAVLLILILLTGVGSIQAQEGQPGAAGIGLAQFPTMGNGGYDVQHIDLILDWRANDNFLNGTMNMEAIATQDLSSFNLDFIGYDIEALYVNEQMTNFSREDTEVIISPSDFLPIGQSFTVEVQYSGSEEPLSSPLVPVPAYGWDTNESGVLVKPGPFASASWHPTSSFDKATYSIQVTVPQPFTVISSGVLTEQHSLDDTSTFVWQITQPITNPAMIIGQFEHTVLNTVTTVPVNIYVREGTTGLSDRKSNLIAEMLDLLIDAFGSFPFDELSIVNASELEGGGFAVPGVTVISSFDTPENVIIHELAHQWFGATVTPIGLENGWLSEGTAMYAETLWLIRNVYYKGPIPFGEAITRTAGVNWLSVNSLDAPGIASEQFSTAIYDRGRFALYALQVKVGSETYFEIMRTVIERYQYDFITTQDFIAVAEEISGQELDEFFDDLLFSNPLPSLEELGIADE